MYVLDSYMDKAIRLGAGEKPVVTPRANINGKLFTERDIKLLDLLLRLEGASLEQINRAVAKKAAAWGYKGDCARLAERLGMKSWTKGHGGTRRYAISP
jgi:hypothetical protein